MTAELFVEDADQLWGWLQTHHAQTDGVWLVTWKRGGGPYPFRDEVLDALIAHGWIDGRRMKRDDGKTMQLVTPRRTDRWTASYRQRAEALIAAGRMHPAGQAAIDRARAAGTWLVDVDVDDGVVPPDLAQALARTGGVGWFASAAPSYVRNVLRFLKAAKRPETRSKRIDLIAAAASRGERLPNY